MFRKGEHTNTMIPTKSLCLVLFTLLIALSMAADDAPGTGGMYSNVTGVEHGHPQWNRSVLPAFAFHIDPAVGPGVRPVPPARPRPTVAGDLQALMRTAPP